MTSLISIEVRALNCNVTTSSCQQNTIIVCYVVGEVAIANCGSTINTCVKGSPIRESSIVAKSTIINANIIISQSH